MQLLPNINNFKTKTNQERKFTLSFVQQRRALLICPAIKFSLSDNKLSLADLTDKGKFLLTSQKSLT
jgi:hypothetical protein